MAAPTRDATPGSEASVLEDLVLARDVVGLAAASRDRLAGTLTLQYGAIEWLPVQVDAVREELARHVRRVCGTYRQSHVDDPCAVAAALSVQRILLQPAGTMELARTIRRAARTEAGCYIADDSLRKRETPVLAAIAHAAYDALRSRPPEDLPTIESAFELMKKYAKVAGEAVAHAVNVFNRRTELDDDLNTIDHAVAYATWSITQVAVFPVYARKVASVVTMPAELSMLDELARLLMTTPFEGREEDGVSLVEASRPREEPRAFLDRLLSAEETTPIVGRLFAWLASCPPSCTYFRSDEPLGYCSPHFYVALCETFVGAVDDLPDGRLREDVQGFLASARDIH